MIMISHISKDYGKKQILQDISFQAECGQLIVIIGQNGCGKTTLMKILAGVMKPNGGEITYFNQDMFQKKNLFQKMCGYLPQENPLMEELSVKDNLRLWGVMTSQYKEMILDMFALRDILSVTVSKLSGGMKRRLSIACALAQWPPVLIMDEPTTALDIHYKEGIHKCLEDYTNKNGIVIMTSHDENEIINSDRCFHMKDGTLQEVSQENKNLTYVKTILQ